MKRIFALVLCIILLFTSCSLENYQVKIDGARYLTNLIKEDMKNVKLYSFCGNILVSGKNEDKLKLFTVSSDTGEIINKTTLNNANYYDIYIGTETFALKRKDSFIIYDKVLNEIGSYEYHDFHINTTDIDPDSKTIYTFNENEGVILKKSLSNDEEKKIFSAESLKYIYPGDKRSGYSFFCYQENKNSEIKNAYIDLSNGEIIHLDIEGNYYNLKSDGTNIFVDKSVKDNELHIITPKETIKFELQINTYLSNDKKHFYIYNKESSALQLQNFNGNITAELKIPSETNAHDVVQDEIIDMVYNEKTDSYYFTYYYRGFVSCVFEWKPEFK